MKLRLSDEHQHHTHTRAVLPWIVFNVLPLCVCNHKFLAFVSVYGTSFVRLLDSGCVARVWAVLANVDIGWFTFVFRIKIDLLKKQCINVWVVTMQLEENIMKWKRTQNYTFTLSENICLVWLGNIFRFAVKKTEKWEMWAMEMCEDIVHFVYCPGAIGICETCSANCWCMLSNVRQ